MSTPQKIFVSYAHPNLARVKSLVVWLRSAGFEVWFDKDSLVAGEQWESVILREIRNARVVLFCLSAEATDRRGFFHREMRAALDVAQNIPPSSLYFIPIRLNECEIPDQISHYHVLDFFTKTAEEPLLKALRKAIPDANKPTPTLTINTRPITGSAGQVLTLTFDPAQSVYSLLTQAYHGLSGHVGPMTYGSIWVLRDDDTGELYDAKNERERTALSFSAIADIGFKPNMRLSTVYLKNHRGSQRSLPNQTNLSTKLGTPSQKAAGI